MNNKLPKILIVDDEPINLLLMDAVISPMNIKVHTADTGVKALEIIEKDPPDAILLDIRMPGLDGIEVCRQLKENPRTRNIPVVFVTAYADVDNHIRAVEAGGIGFITKPINKILVEVSVLNALRIKKLSDDVEQLLHQRSALTRMIVHDINNLLTSIIINFSFMVENAPPDCSPQEEISALQSACNDLKTLTAGLMDVERLESGKMPMDIQHIPLWQVVEERTRIILPQAQDRQEEIKLIPTSGEITVQADQDLLRRVMDNLLFNAVKFCPDRGTITVKAQHEDGKCLVSVINDGEPIPREYHNKIFEKFAQVDVRSATGRKGMGLGLTFCKMAIEAMGGSIKVESPVNGRTDGVEFLFQLPI